MPLSPLDDAVLCSGLWLIVSAYGVMLTRGAQKLTSSPMRSS